MFGEVGQVAPALRQGHPQVLKRDARRCYLDSRGDVYRDKLSDPACAADTASGGLVIDHLAAIYDHVYVDEVQDLAGYDLELLDLLFTSSIAVTVVGDPRQGAYSANDSGENRKYRRRDVAD
ncbi:UvrD-helicase domain-containing protein [Actinomadura sp. KC06]|uniref:UvrD-helicase domain-containing protein n=1 Tax=Actinomadura sp. KC06 TaxID=2530369 RepID=UPI001A9E9BE3|nr:UvrD-helicase domain-containing protein [Actinomadura sp. KC06]